MMTPVFDAAFRRATGEDIDDVRRTPVDVRRGRLLAEGIIDDTIGAGCLGIVSLGSVGREFDRDFGLEKRGLLTKVFNNPYFLACASGTVGFMIYYHKEIADYFSGLF